MKYVISFDGRENIEIVEKFLGGKCYKAMKCGDKYLGQIEVVIPYGESGWVFSSKKEGLVDLSYIPEENIELAIDSLESLGISGIIMIGYDFDEIEQHPEVDSEWCCATMIGNKEYNNKRSVRNREYTIVFDGGENMAVAKKFMDGHICRSMTYGSDYLGQMEIDYNHGVAKVKYVTEDMLVFTVNSLENMGINGVVCIKCEAEFDGVSIEEPGWYFALKVGNNKSIKKHLYQISLYRGNKLSTVKIEEEPKEAMRIVTHEGTAKGVTEALLISCETGEILCQLQDGIITYVAGVGNPFKNNFR